MSLWKPSAFLVGFLLLIAAIGLTLAQIDDRFLFPDEIDERSVLSKELELAQKINDMESVDDFLKHVKGVPERPPFVASLAGRMGSGDGQERSQADRPIPARCSPELQPVSLKIEEDPSTLYFPSCTRIKRCGGCCTHAGLSCQPVASNFRNFEVMVVSVGATNEMTYKEKRIVPLEEHTKCKCDCRIKQEHCNEKQSYVQPECRCRCDNVDEEEKCRGKNETKIWNPDLCVCMCRDEQECSTGFYFDQNTCRCKQFPLSRSWFQPTKGTDYKFSRTQKPDTVPPVIVPLDAADPRRKPKDDPEY
ncbi:PDGF- and VEGF-related factor 1 isoform X2 [Halictus rubicundus]|uniref:PDGF- and VEGF-related factor 1 isoform X2 n=1 Tax=Halictus rubicundus TaxID=77578 RepID=UPI004036D0AF